MPRIKKVKPQKQYSLPASINDRQLLDSLLNEVVEYKTKAKYYSDLAKGSISVITDPDGKLNLDSKYVAKLIKAKVDLYKTKQEASGLQSASDDVENLTKKNEEVAEEENVE